MSTTQPFLPGQLGTLVDLTSKLLEIENEDQLLQTIVDSLVYRFGYDVAYFRMVAPDSYLEIRAHAGTQSDFLHNPKERRMPPGGGINGKAISTGKVIAISDVSEDSSYYYPEVKERENLKGMLAAPMYSSGKRVGVLSCYTRIPHEFTEEEKQFASALASMTSVILSNIRYFEEVDTLSNFSQALVQGSELVDILNRIVEYAQQFASADGVRLFAYDFEKGQFNFRLQAGRGIGQSSELARRERPNKNKLAMQVLEQGLISLEGESISRSQLLGEETKQVLLDEGIQAFAGLALKTKEPVGVLYIFYKNSTDLPNQQEIKTKFDKFLRNAAIAIERAWLFEYLQQERKLLEFASNVTSEVRDVNDVWREFLSYAMRLTGAMAGNISIVSKDGRHLERPVHHGFPENVDYRHRIGGRSIQGQSVALKQSILIRNVRTDSEWKDSYYGGLPSTVSELVVPVYDSGSEKQRVIGVINLEHFEESAFDEHHLRLIELLSVHATISLRIAENYKRIDLEGSRLRTLQKAAKAIITRSKHQNILETILQEAVELTGAPIATIQMLVGDHLQFKEIYPVSLWETIHKLIPNGIMRLDGGRGLTVQAANERLPILVNDVYSNSAYWDGSNNRTRSELAVPMLIDHDQLWGVLNVEKEIKDGFTEEDQETLTALANLALAAVQSDEYYTDIQRAKNVEAISHVLLSIMHHLNNQISLIPVEAVVALDEIKHSSLNADQIKVVRKHLRKIIKNGREITNQILEIYQPFTSPLETVNLPTLCKRLEKSIQLPSNINLEVYLDANVSDVLASRAMLFMILENMLQNSITQLPDGGRIWIKSEPIDTDWARVHIYDNGVGIPPDKLRKLSRFSFDFDTKQLNEPRAHKGLGLGLSLAYWFVKRLGGNLQIESRVTEIDHGTRITLKLPRPVERQWNRLGH